MSNTTTTTDSTNLFLTASRKKLRFASARGHLSVEDLWDIRLEDLDELAIALRDELAHQSRQSFIKDTPSKKASDTQLALDIAKAVIEIRLAERAAAKDRTIRLQELQTLKAALEQKQIEAIEGMSTEDLQKKIAELQSQVG